MSKIINIENEIVIIGTDNGGIQEVRISDCNFEPAIGDEVEIFSTETKTVVIKKQKELQNNANLSQGAININVSNSNTIPQTPLYVTGGKVVNKLIYCILAFFLGGIGVHKFYAGKIGTGIIFFIFCWTWIPVIIGVIDCIIASFKESDANGNIIV